MTAFSLFGPTCDSADVMHGPFVLPADIAEGDWIEIGQLGAYGACLRTAFNGFDRAGSSKWAMSRMLGTPAYGVESLRHRRLIAFCHKGNRPMKHVAFGGRLVMLGLRQHRPGRVAADPASYRHAARPDQHHLRRRARRRTSPPSTASPFTVLPLTREQFPRRADAAAAGAAISC